MNGNLIPQCTYSKVMLTVIAVLLAWSAISREPVQAVHAQSKAGTVYRAVSLATVPVSIDQQPDGTRERIPFESRLNEAVQGGDIVEVIPFGIDNGTVLVIYKER